MKSCRCPCGLLTFLFLVVPSVGVGCFFPPPQDTTVSSPPPVQVAPEPAPEPVPEPAPTPAPFAQASGAISYPGEVVRYPLTIDYTRTVSIYVEGYGLDPTVRVYDGYGNQVGFNDDGGSGLDSQLVLTLVPGTYVVEVAGYAGSTGGFAISAQ